MTIKKLNYLQIHIKLPSNQYSGCVKLKKCEEMAKAGGARERLKE